jgi:hypothetical protein
MTNNNLINCQRAASAARFLETNAMKKLISTLFAALFVSALFVSCTDIDSWVTINSLYHRTLEEVKCNGAEFGDIPACTASAGGYTECYRGTYVSPGKSVISFHIKGANKIVAARTVDKLKIESDCPTSFTFTANTMVEDVSDPGKQMTLLQLAGDAYLTIKNESGMDLQEVMWNNVTFNNGIANSASVEKMVSGGIGKINFTVNAAGVRIDARTYESKLVNAGGMETFTFNASTPVEKISDIGNSMTLSQLK